MVSIPMVLTVAMRMPAMIDGTASGSSTFQSRWRALEPHAVDASRTSAGTCSSPVTVFRTRISSV